MRFALSLTSRVLVELRATGLLRAVGHDPTLVARPEPAEIDVGSGPVDASVDVRFLAERIEIPAELSASDRARMRDNLLSRDVLDASRHAHVELRARYRGTTEQGRLEGSLVVRGVARPITMDVRATADGSSLRVTGAWEGRLTDLGIKPFKALMGALRLEDWIRLRLDAQLAPATP